MPLLSNHSAFDKQAGARAKTAIDSWSANRGTGFTVEEVCILADFPMPVSEDDLELFARFCEIWGIKTNIDTVGYFQDMRSRYRAAFKTAK